MTDENSESEKIKYEVTVITGDVKYAGTDANVYIEMIGKEGRSGEIELDDHRNNFERGLTELFKVNSKSL